MSPASAIPFGSGRAWELALLGLLAVALIVAGVRMFLKSRQTAADRERRRRITINRTGRMGDGTIIDVRDFVLFYSYQVRGVSYTTSQDATDLKDLLPSETAVLIGPVGLKYSTRNPANSIVVCEDWSGLPRRVHISSTQENDLT